MRIWENRFWGSLLWPASLAYGLVIALRNRMYDRNSRKSLSLNARVIGVGNITVGGTGKTPMVQFLARALSVKGIPVAVLSRGYGGKGKGIRILKNGDSPQADPRIVGDEPVLLAKTLPGVPIVVSPDRIKAGQWAVRRFGSRVLVLDDAFQHRRIRRDLDIVMVRAENPFGNGWLLPAGPLREPLSSLRRCRAVVVTGPRESASDSGLALIRRWTTAPVWFAEHRPSVWIEQATGKSFSLDLLRGRPVLAFSGIANPGSFEKTVLDTGAVPAKCIRYPDHFFYRARDLTRLARAANRIGACAVVTTEKDRVRIAEWTERLPLYCLRIRIEVDGLEKLLKMCLDIARG